MCVCPAGPQFSPQQPPQGQYPQQQYSSQPGFPPSGSSQGQGGPSPNPPGSAGPPQASSSSFPTGQSSYAQAVYSSYSSQGAPQQQQVSCSPFQQSKALDFVFFWFCFFVVLVCTDELLG